MYNVYACGDSTVLVIPFIFPSNSMFLVSGTVTRLATRQLCSASVLNISYRIRETARY